MGARILVRSAIACAVTVLLAGPAPVDAAQPARQMYEAAMAREKALRSTWDESQSATAKQARAIVAAYESIVRRHPTSPYCDNALWQAAGLAADAFTASRQPSDRQTAVRLLEFLAREYPTSSFAAKAADQARRLHSTAPANAPNTAKSAEASKRGRDTSPNAMVALRTGPQPASPSVRAAVPPVPADPIAPAPNPADDKAAASNRRGPPLATIRQITRTVLPEVVRVSIELDREVIFRAERVEGPPRLLFDLPATKTAPAMQDANLAYQDDVVHGIRVGRHPQQTTRVVLDLEGVSHYAVVTLYNPYRILIDCERAAATPASVTAPERLTPGAAGERAKAPRAEPAKDEKVADPPKTSKPAKVSEAPKVNDTAKIDNTPGKERVSMARQLGLGVSRIVIDPGHGGRDPGAEGPNVTESDIVLDIALRVEKALARQPGLEVILTRRTDVFVPLEERTQIANREHADLFLSIHANASRNQSARGIESYYLNFASNPEAEAVAARENSASERTMNSLTDIVKAIALNNKLDESKDLAGMVQQAMARRLKPSNRSLKDLGVKKAPFVVLIGATMPSVLAEVSFVTNWREAQLLRTDAYRQRIADALADAVLRYRRTLKAANAVATQESGPVR